LSTGKIALSALPVLTVSMASSNDSQGKTKESLKTLVEASCEYEPRAPWNDIFRIFFFS
jgi:hypothetical protein